MEILLSRVESAEFTVSRAEDTGKLGKNPSRSCGVPMLRKATRWVYNPLPSALGTSASAGSSPPVLSPNQISISRSFASGKLAYEPGMGTGK